jgi:TPR repeat protein
MWFQRAADQGNANGYHNLGVEAYRVGDMPAAAEWFRKSAAAGVRRSFAFLGTILEKGGDIAGATQMFRSGADKDCPDCQRNLGRLAFHEKTQESYQRARYWDEKAAAQGEAASQARLGTIDHDGLGVEHDPEQAVHWWQQAARQGHHVAQYKMGVACHEGTGTKKDRLAAMRFLMASAARGDNDAKSYLPRVVTELTAEERSQLESEATTTKQ